MNIDTKRYSLRSDGTTATIRARSSGRIHSCPASRLPSLVQLTIMSEWDFDTVMQKEMS